jgi:DNA-binding transcriptional LysR family regulator
MVTWMFDPVLLRSFVAVVDCGNFTRAAERLHLTQSTVSQQIRRLEDALACQLLDRDQRRVVATTEGERLLAYARRILALHEEAAEVLISQQSDGVLRLGVPEDFAAERLMPLLSSFVQAYPRVRLEVTSGLGPELQRQYRAGEFDLLLVKQMGDSADCLASWPEPLCWGWTAAPHHPWGATRCRWWPSRWAACTAMKCCSTWKWAAGAGVSVTQARVWPACVRRWRLGWG